MFGQIKVSAHSAITFGLLQLPAVSLAFYGIYCAFQQTKVVDKMRDSLLAMLILVLPYCVTELVTLVLQFPQIGEDSVLGKVNLCL